MKSILSLVLLLGILSVSYAQQGQNSDENMIKQMSAQKGYKDLFLGNFRCGLFVPPSYDPQKKYPLLIYFHGYNDTVTYTLRWYEEPLLSDYPCIVLTPKCPVSERGGWGTSWDTTTTPMMQKAFEMIALTKKAFNLDENRFYICGRSMGGIGTYGVIQKYPDMFAAGYVECARGNIAMAPILAKIPFWMFHGTHDPVVPVKGARDMDSAVHAIGGTLIRYTEYPEAKHNTWDYIKYETTLGPWLLSQRKGSVHGTPNGISTFQGKITDKKEVLLEWSLPMDPKTQDNKTWFCKIYRDGKVIKEIYNDKTSYTDTMVSADKTYKYVMTMVNYFFKESPLSKEVTLTIK
jgi:predicted esterase